LAISKILRIFDIQIGNTDFSSLNMGMFGIDCHANGNTTSREMILSLNIVSKQ